MYREMVKNDQDKLVLGEQTYLLVCWYIAIGAFKASLVKQNLTHRTSKYTAVRDREFSVKGLKTLLLAECFICSTVLSQIGRAREAGLPS